jgi:dihydropteroate synthase
MQRCTVNGRVIGGGAPVCLMGVINCSPESFYPGSYVPAGRVHAEACRMVDEGAEIVDVGARSTAPRAPPLSKTDEAKRMDAALGELDGSGITVSVDTLQPCVFAVCLDHDIHAANDISGLADPEFAEILAASGLPAFLMASKNVPGDATSLPETISNIALVVSRCEAAGVTEYVLDPGIGLWTPARNTALDWEISRNFGDFARFNRPLLAAVSRKTFLGDVTGRPPEHRLAASLALTAMLLAQGADVVRTHDVAETRDVIRVSREMEGQR